MFSHKAEVGREFAAYCLRRANEITRLGSFIEDAKKEAARVGFPFTAATRDSITRWHAQAQEPRAAKRRREIERRAMRARIKRQRRIDLYRTA